MIYTEDRKVTHISHEDVPVRGECDVCRKELLQRNDGLYDYYRIVTHHNNWGNDSIDSFETMDFCCMDCMMEYIRKYWNDKREGYIPGRDTYRMEVCHMYNLRKSNY